MPTSVSTATYGSCLREQICSVMCFVCPLESSRGKMPSRFAPVRDATHIINITCRAPCGTKRHDDRRPTPTSDVRRSQINTGVCVCVFYSATLYGIHFGPASHIEAESTNGTFNPREWVNILSDTAEWRWFSWRDDVYLRAKTQHWVTWTVSSESNFHYRYVSSEERSACVCSHDCSSSPWNVSPLIDRNERNTRATLINYSSILV